MHLDERRREIAGRRRSHGAPGLPAARRPLGAALAADRRELGMRTERSAGTAVIVVEGEIDIASADQLAERLDEVAASGAGTVWVDLTAVAFMDSTGVATLLAARRVLPPGTELGVVCPAGPCRRLLELTGVPRLIAIVPERAAPA